MTMEWDSGAKSTEAKSSGGMQSGKWHRLGGEAQEIITNLKAELAAAQQDLDKANEYHVGILNAITAAFPECARLMLADSVNAMIAYTQKAREGKKAAQQREAGLVGAIKEHIEITGWGRCGFQPRLRSLARKLLPEEPPSE